MSDQDIKSDFPKLRQEGYRITSEETSDYNCFAWAAQDTTDWWSPIPTFGYYWPEKDVPRSEDLAAFTQLYKFEMGFEPCDTGEPELGFEKIALYRHPSGNITHAARLKENGTWTSKLGTMEDIEHNTLTGLEGDDYGAAVQFLKRPLAV